MISCRAPFADSDPDRERGVFWSQADTQVPPTEECTWEPYNQLRCSIKAIHTMSLSSVAFGTLKMRDSYRKHALQIEKSSCQQG